MLGYCFNPVGDFGDDNNIAAAGNTRVERKPSRLMSHNFYHHNTVMTRRRRMQPVNSIRCNIKRGVEAEAHIIMHNIVIDGFRNTDDIQSFICEHIGSSLRAIAAEDGETV